MGLLEQHQAERRGRILAAARRLIAARGYDGLTMRELARESRVSVPTLYNLFGGKRALLLGELEETFTAVAAAVEHARGTSFVERALAACEAGNRDLLAVPRYTRELVHLFLVSEETRAIRQATADRYIAMMVAILADAQAAGDVAAWVEPAVLSRRMFAHYEHTMIQWAQEELDAEGFRAATQFGMCVMLRAVARGGAARELERRLRTLQAELRPAAAPRRRSRARKGG
jgi:AcrR family transcriptional regulator